ncbi:MAG: saccharopine dehydrogenase NADP-binding domain-containing protein [Aggregatilineales bacterium]
MHVIILGLGGMGHVTAHTVAKMDFVDRITVADLNRQRTDSVAESIGNKAYAAQVDVTDQKRVTALFKDADLILNSVGPFYRFGVPILESAIEAGTDYADINDDWQPTQDMLRRHDRAQQAGITAIIGLGASPGISNLLAAKASTYLDRVDNLLTGWDSLSAIDDSLPETDNPGAALIHWLHQTSGHIPLYQNGMLTRVKPLQEYRFHYPDYGHAVTWTVGHPEPLTLPSSIQGLEFSANVMTGSREMITLLQHTAHEIDSGRQEIDIAATSFLNQLGENIEQLTQRTGDQLPRLFAVAFGHRDGRATTVGATLKSYPTGGMGGSTGIPLALTAQLLNDGHLNKSGVYPPEGILQADQFFNILAPYVEGHYDTGDDLVEITQEARVDFSAVSNNAIVQ